MSTVTQYWEGVPEPQRSTLLVVWQRLRQLLPQAQETISYGVPTLKVDGAGVAGVSASKKHCSYLPMSGSVLSSMADELTGYTWSKGALKFPIDQPLPDDLLVALVRARLAEVAGD